MARGGRELVVPCLSVPAATLRAIFKSDCEDGLVTFLNELCAGIDDPSVVGLAVEHDLEPIAEAHTPVAPPTYKGDSGPEFPVSRESPIPEAGEGGWLSRVRRDERGAAVTSASVVLDSVGSSLVVRSWRCGGTARTWVDCLG